MMDDWPWFFSPLFELAVIFLIEIFTRQLFHGRNSSKFALFSLQLGFLVLFAMATLLHHKPYVLLVTAVGVSIRMVWNTRKSPNKYLSKPLPRNTSVGTEQSSSNSLLSPSYYYDHAQSLSQHDKLYLHRDHHLDMHQSATNTSGSKPTPWKSSYKKNVHLTREPLPNNHTDRSPSYIRSPRSLFQWSTSSSGLPSWNSVATVFNYTPYPCPRGLVNPGNTCFINSVLQCLIWTPGFVESLTTFVVETKIDSLFLTTLLQVMQEVVQETELCQSVDMSNLLLLLANLAPHLVSDNLSHQSQQDGAEFLLWLLNHTHSQLSTISLQSADMDISELRKEKQAYLDELSRMESNEQSFIAKLLDYSKLDWDIYTMQTLSTIYNSFLGQLLEARECQLCKKVSLNIEYFMILPLPLPKSTGPRNVSTLEECFDLFSEIENLTDSNMIACTCLLSNKHQLQSLTPGVRRSLLSKPPKNLIVQLSRYSYNINSQTTIKNRGCILFQTTFNLPPSVLIEAQLQTSSAEQVTYSLVGICVHSGADTTSHGHYVAYCQTQNGWFYFSDRYVSRVGDIEELLKENFLLQNAYLLFYSRIITK